MVETKDSSARFHLTSPDDFFYCLKHALKQYQNDKVKRIESLFFLIMGLTHLREWIAPDYNHKQPATTEAQKFYKKIYTTSEFQKIQSLCNGIKHLKSSPVTSYRANLSFDEWPDINSVVKWDDGPPTAFYVDGEDVGDILQELVDSYQAKWFSREPL